MNQCYHLKTKSSVFVTVLLNTLYKVMEEKNRIVALLLVENASILSFSVLM